MKEERAELDEKIELLEKTLAKFGVKTRRGPGRPKGSKNRRGPGRPPGSGKKKATKKTKKKVTRNWTPEKREAARQRMKKIWAERKKKAKKSTTKKKTAKKK